MKIAQRLRVRCEFPTFIFAFVFNHLPEFSEFSTGMHRLDWFPLRLSFQEQCLLLRYRFSFPQLKCKGKTENLSLLCRERFYVFGTKQFAQPVEVRCG